VHRVLLALDRPGVVPPAALARRHRQVALLGPGLDLGEDLVLQRRERRRGGLGKGVLGLEVGDRVRVVAVGEPGVLVVNRVAVVGALAWDLLGERRRALGFGAHNGPVY
jgi:hypothetical protein